MIATPSTKRKRMSRLTRYLVLVIVLSFFSIFYPSILQQSTQSTMRLLIRAHEDSLCTLSTNQIPQRSFPKWGTSIEEENTVGLSLAPILDFLFTSSAYLAAPVNSNQRQLYRPLLDRAWTETLYVIEPGGTLWTSNLHRNINNVPEKPKVERRFNSTERLMLNALEIIQRDYQQRRSCDKSQWPTLCQTIFPLSSTIGGNGFPFLSCYGDYDSCGYHNWVSSSGQTVSVPLFTVAARLDCNYTIPFPNYYSHLMSSSKEWDDLFQLYNRRYPWKSKAPQVVWRGGMTGIIHNETAKCPRWRMIEAVQAIDSQPILYAGTQAVKPLFDVAITQIPDSARRFAPKIEEELGPINKRESMDFIDFQKYRAILDVDGFSWSGRFGSLLCFNSVVLKVEPTFVDYFYYKYDNPRVESSKFDNPLRPWEHYIPIQEDFSDLQEKAEFVTDPKNDEVILQIIRNANEWCRVSFVDKSFAVDMLDIWERYVKLLYINDPKWNIDEWKHSKSLILNSSSLFDMVELSLMDYTTRKDIVKMEPANLTEISSYLQHFRV